MDKWALVDKSSGVVTNIVDSEEKPTTFNEFNTIEWIKLNKTGGPGWRYNFQTKDFELLEYQKRTTISRLQLIEELKDSYKNVITAAKTDIDVEIWLEKFRMQDSFELFEDKTKDQINFLVTKKLLSKSEADKLLSL